MMGAILRRSSTGNRCFQRRHRQPGVYGAAKGIADDPARPGIQDHREIDEVGDNGDVGEILSANSDGGLDSIIYHPGTAE